MSCCAFCTSSARRFATFSFSLTKQRFMHALLCRFFNTSKPRARFLRCQRPLFLFGGQVKQRTIDSVRDNPSSPAFALPNIPFSPFSSPKSLVWAISRHPYEPRTPRKVSSAFAPSSRRSHTQSLPVHLRMKAYDSRREFISSFRCSGGAIGGELSAVWQDGPQWGST